MRLSTEAQLTGHTQLISATAFHVRIPEFQVLSHVKNKIQKPPALMTSPASIPFRDV